MPTKKETSDASSRLARLSGELSGAFGDLGTFLPYVVPALASGLLLPAPLFAGFAVGYLVVAAVYRVPIAIQPMKAIGAVIVTGGLTTMDIAWAGTLLGLALLALAATPALERWTRAIPQSVVVGLQVGLALTMGTMAVRLMDDDPFLAAGAVALLGLTFIWPRGPWALLLVAIGIVAGPWVASSSPIDALASVEAEGFSLIRALTSGVIPQLPLTLLNAIVLAAAVSHSLFGAEARGVTERRLAFTSGGLNLALAPFGAMPMCHGAGGIAAHHRFGARGMGAPLVMAAACIIAALAGGRVLDLIIGIPAPIIGGLLLYAAVDLGFSRRLLDARPDCRPVIGAVAVATLVWGPAVGLVVGLAGEMVRAYLARLKHSRRQK